MGSKGGTITVLILMAVGAIIGAIIGYLITPSAVAIVIGAAIGAVAIWLFAIIPPDFWEILFGIGQLIECCALFGVLSLTVIVTLSGLFLWHSFMLAALTGVSAMTVLLVVLSIAAYSYRQVSTKSSSPKF